MQQISDHAYNNLKDITGKSFKLLDYKTGSESKLGDKRGFEIDFQEKQGKREDIQKSMSVLYLDPDANESKTLLVVHSKIRDKYSNEMLPLRQTMIDSFRFTDMKVPLDPVDSK